MKGRNLVPPTNIIDMKPFINQTSYRPPSKWKKILNEVR